MAQPGKWPWQVQLQINLGNGQGNICGGSILNEKMVLTAGHCLLGELKPESITVYAGWNGKVFGAGVATLLHKAPKVERFIIHENYTDSDTPFNDIGLIELKQGFTLNGFVTP